MPFTASLHTNEQSIDPVLGGGMPVLRAFWPKECAPCQQLDPMLTNLAKAYIGKMLISKDLGHSW
jgi:thiol-disulfide isomerase/thioredoxin